MNGEWAYDKRASSAQEFIDFFINGTPFQIHDRFEATTPGLGGWIFRGQSSADWNLLPKAFRNENSLQSYTPQPPVIGRTSHSRRVDLGAHLQAESRAVFLFMEYADRYGIPTPLDYGNGDVTNDLLKRAMNEEEEFDPQEEFPRPELYAATALAQHHGVPTRFLDWSESPLVACYFAAYGASSLAQTKEKSRKKGEIAVYFLHHYTLRRNRDAIKVIRSPRRENPNQRAQKGLFTCDMGLNEVFLRYGRWRALDEPGTVSCQLGRIRLKSKHADEVLKILFHHDISRHSLMPSLENASAAYAYVHALFGNN